LVSPEDSHDRDLQRILRMTEEGYEAPTKLLELNRKHPLIVNLGRRIQENREDAVAQATIEQLFANARLLDGQTANPIEMVDRIQKLMEAAVATKAD
jgi:molecular chaperone HtpG